MYHWFPLYMILQKRKQWEDIAARFVRVIDGLGTKIDPGILETVIALNALGIETSASCEGHLDHGTGAPWIDIEVLSASEQSIHVAEMFTQANKAFEEQTLPEDAIDALFAEAHREQDRIKVIHLEQCKILMSYLAAFYAVRRIPYDRQLAMHPRDMSGRVRMESHGADFQSVAPLEMRAQKLAEYQEEMQAFTEFLKQIYFDEAKEAKSA